MSRTLRPTDMHGEAIVKEYLIRFFYDRIRAGLILEKIADYQSIDSIEQQYQGIDIILTLTDGRQLIIDEKCALKYINTNLSTFAFEIQYLNSAGLTKDGWFIDDALQTQYYFVMWIKGRPLKRPGSEELLEGYDYIKKMTVDDLTFIELYSIKKTSLRRYLNKIGWSVDKMRTQADRMRTYNTEQTPVRPGVKFYYSGYLAEKPVNLVIKKTLLKAIADTVFEIMPDRVLRDGAVIYEASKKL